jgi:adenylate cyclase
MAGGDRYLAAIMFTDLVGYSAMMRRDEALALELLEEHWAILRPLFPDFGGREVKTIGDAFLIEFHSALKAVQCAVAMQSVLAKRNQDQSDDHHINLRIGIHLGDVEARGGDVFGDGVNIAARVEPQAASGGICITETVYQQVQNKVQLDYRRLGSKNLKNVGPVTLYSIPPPGGTRVDEAAPRVPVETSRVRILRRIVTATVAIGFAVLAIWGALIAYPLIFDDELLTVSADTKSLIILPFSNRSPEPGNDYLADSMSDELRVRLGHAGGLRVTPGSTSRQYAFKPPTLSQIIAETGATAMLEGSIWRSGDQLRVTVELADTVEELILWSETYDRQYSDFLAIQVEIATSVAEALRASVAGDDLGAVAALPTTDVAAYDLYMQAHDHLDRRTDADLRYAVELYRQAIEIDPGLVRAHAGLAMAYLLQEVFGNLTYDEAIERAREAVDTAVSLNPDRSEVQAALGLLLSRTDQPEQAEIALLRAIALDDSNADAYLWLGKVYSDMERLTEELDLYELGLRTDPQHVELNRRAASAYARSGNYEQALAIYERLLLIDPLNQLTYLNGLAGALSETGDIAGAIRRYVEIIRAIPYSRQARARTAYWLISLGQDQSAEVMIDTCLDLDPDYGRCRAANGLLLLYRDELAAEPSIDRNRHSREYRLHGLAALRRGNAETAIRWFWHLRDRMPRGIPIALDAGYPSTIHEVIALERTGQQDIAAARLGQFEFVVNAAFHADRGRPASAYYALAQMAAVAGEGDRSAAELRQAFEHGWRNARFARIDPALASVLDRPDVMTLLGWIDDDVEVATASLDLDALDIAARAMSADPILLTEAELGEYEGFYEWDAYTITTFQVTDGRLFERQTDGKDIELFPIGDDRFYSPDGFFTVRFGRGPDDQITHYLLASEAGETRRVRRIQLPPTITLTGDQLDGYVGWYQAADRPDQVTAIVREGDSLIDQTTGQPALTLRAIAADVFEYDPLEFVARSTFERDASGAVVRISFSEGHRTVIRERIPVAVSITQDAALARRMEGRYLSLDGGLSYQVISSGDLLEIRWAPAGSAWRKSSWYELFPAGGGRYFFDDEQLVAEIQFELPAAGSATSLVIEFGDGEVWEANRDTP